MNLAGAIMVLGAVVLGILAIRGTYKLFPPWQNVGKLNTNVQNTIQLLSQTPMG